MLYVRGLGPSDIDHLFINDHASHTAVVPCALQSIRSYFKVPALTKTTARRTNSQDWAGLFSYATVPLCCCIWLCSVIYRHFAC